MEMKLAEEQTKRADDKRAAGAAVEAERQQAGLSADLKEVRRIRDYDNEMKEAKVKRWWRGHRKVSVHRDALYTPVQSRRLFLKGIGGEHARFDGAEVEDCAGPKRFQRRRMRLLDHARQVIHVKSEHVVAHTGPETSFPYASIELIADGSIRTAGERGDLSKELDGDMSDIWDYAAER